MTWNKIRLELARTPESPVGDPECGYELVAPLDPEGYLDETAWRINKNAARVTRFWRNEESENGNLIHTRHRTWAFSYQPGEDDDEPFFHLETHRLAPGEYVTIRETDGRSLPFCVVRVERMSVAE